MTLVSVVIPAYNAEATIGEAVRSVLGQTMDDLDVIVCNDASTDGTVDVLAAMRDPRVKVLHNECNLGEGATRDRAIYASTGRWIALLDADDAWTPNRLQLMLSAAGGSDTLLIFDDLMICHHTEQGLRPWRAVRGRYAFGADGVHPIDVKPAEWAASFQFLMQPMIPGPWLRDSGVHHTGLVFGADTEFLLHLVAKGLRMRYVPHAGYLYRITPGSMSSNPDKVRIMREMLETMLPLFDDRPIMQAALRHRIAYKQFTTALKSGHLVEAFRLALGRPSLSAEFLQRSINELRYVVSRRWHSAEKR